MWCFRAHVMNARHVNSGPLNLVKLCLSMAQLAQKIDWAAAEHRFGGLCETGVGKHGQLSVQKSGALTVSNRQPSRSVLFSHSETLRPMPHTMSNVSPSRKSGEPRAC